MTKLEVLKAYAELQKLEEKMRQVAQDINIQKAEKTKHDKEKKDMMVEGYVEGKAAATHQMKAVLGDITKAEKELTKLQEIRDGLVDKVAEQHEKFKKALDELKKKELEKLDKKTNNLEAQIEGANNQLRKLYEEQKEINELREKTDKYPEILIEKEAEELTKKPKAQAALPADMPLGGDDLGKTIIMPKAKTEETEEENG